MRLTTVFRRLLCLQAVRVTNVELRTDALVVFVDVELQRRTKLCPRCGRRSRAGTYDSKVRLWRHLDLGAWEVYLRARQRRFHCRRCDAVVTEAVPWAEPGSAFSRVFEDLVSFFAQQTNQTVVSRGMHIAWPTVGNIIARVGASRSHKTGHRDHTKRGIAIAQNGASRSPRDVTFFWGLRPTPPTTAAWRQRDSRCSICEKSLGKSSPLGAPTGK